MHNMLVIKKRFVILKTLAFTLIFLVSCGKITAPADDIPPAMPANFILIGAGDGQASFRWAANSEADFAKFLIYRAVGSATDFVQIAETTANEFVDQFLEYERVYYYYITAVDFAGNQSNSTVIIDVRPLNVSSPAPPRNITVFGHNYSDLNQLEMVISWTPPSASDIWKYFVYKSSTPGFEASSENLIDSTTVSIFADRDVKPGDVFYYRISTMDLGRRQGIPSSAKSDVILEKVLLESPSNRIQFGSPFQFSWKKVEGAQNYKIFVSTSPLANVVWSSAKTQQLNGFYAGSALTPGALYYWWVSAYSQNNLVNDDGDTVEPDVNTRSDIWTFFVR